MSQDDIAIIVNYMAENGVTRAALSAMTGLSKTTIHRLLLCKQNFTIGTLGKIVAALPGLEIRISVTLKGG